MFKEKLDGEAQLPEHKMKIREETITEKRESKVFKNLTDDEKRFYYTNFFNKKITKFPTKYDGSKIWV